VAKLIANLRHDWHMFWLMWRVQLKAEAHLRGAFALQIVGMIVNNMGLLVAWLFLFSRFGTINGWGTADFIGMSGINMLIFGVVSLLNSGLMELPRYVDTGSFDNFLTRPASVLAQLSSSRIEVAVIGDFILGAVLVGWYMMHAHVALVSVGLFLLAAALGSVLLWCFLFWPAILSFYLYDSMRIGRAFTFFFLDTGIFPTGVISGAGRVALLTIWPGLFVGVVPLDVLRGLHWELLWVGTMVTGLWLAFTLWFFKKALRRYESANLIGAR
jgi:ABC-2 type transport system permease protein